MTNDGAADHPPGEPQQGPDTTPARLRPAWNRIRNRLVEGLLVILPILVTFWIVRWMYSGLKGSIIEPLAVFLLWKVRRLQNAPELPAWFEDYAAPIIAALIALVILYVCGALAHSRLRRITERFLLQVPVVAPIYDAARSVFACLERSNGQAATQRVVLVAFPHPGMRLPALVTSTCRDVSTGKALLCVYVPTTPMPTSGFFLIVPEDETTELNWGLQQTLQAIISGGMTAPSEVTYYGVNPAAVKWPPATPIDPAAVDALPGQKS